jgi:hypothetical protein
VATYIYPQELHETGAAQYLLWKLIHTNPNSLVEYGHQKFGLQANVGVNLTKDYAKVSVVGFSQTLNS